MSQKQRVSCPSCEKKYAGVVGDEDDGGSLPVILPCLCVFCKACALAEEAKKHSIIIEPGDLHFYGPKPPRHFFRLGFSAIPTDRIRPGLKLLAGLIRQLS